MKIINGPQYSVHIGTFAFDHISMSCKSKYTVNQAGMSQAESTGATLGHFCPICVHSISEVKHTSIIAKGELLVNLITVIID
jgi:hypothetical protein